MSQLSSRSLTPPRSARSSVASAVMRFGQDKFGDSLPGRSLNGAYDSRGARAHQRVSAAESCRSRVADSVQQDTLKPPRAAGWGKVEHLGHGPASIGWA